MKNCEIAGVCIFLSQISTYMKNRKERLPVIVYLLTNKMIGSQDELLSELALRGYDITQATLSRDLKQLKTAKVPNGKGGYRYVLSVPMDNSSARHGFDKFIPVSPVIDSIARSGNILIIKTPIQHAGMLAHSFRSVSDRSLLASVAIEDVVLLILAQKVTDDYIYAMLTSIIDKSIVRTFCSSILTE